MRIRTVLCGRSQWLKPQLVPDVCELKSGLTDFWSVYNILVLCAERK